jgi:hypothetical protein
VEVEGETAAITSDLTIKSITRQSAEISPLGHHGMRVLRQRLSGVSRPGPSHPSGFGRACPLPLSGFSCLASPHGPCATLASSSTASRVVWRVETAQSLPAPGFCHHGMNGRSGRLADVAEEAGDD